MLITFLGKVPTEAGGQYKKTTYRHGDKQFECQFLGTGLAQALGIRHVRILGTRGSMWDVLLDQLGTNDESSWLELSEAVHNETTTPELLQRFEQELNQRQTDRRFDLRLIPYGSTDSDQVAIINALTQDIASGHHSADQLSLDITHALRHLPMLGLLGAFYLETLGKLKIRDIFYGAFGQGDPTPIINLKGLIILRDWLTALDRFEKDSDYGVFAPLLDNEGIDAKPIQEAAYYERIGNLSRAKAKITSFLDRGQEPKTPASQLFFPLLRERLEWRRNTRRSEWEHELAHRFLKHRDFLRATIFAYESIISCRVEQERNDTNDFKQREIAEYAIEGEAHAQRIDFKDPGNFSTLKFLRNQLAHGLRSQTEHGNWVVQQKALAADHLTQNEQRLSDWLKRALKAQHAVAKS